VCQGVVQKGLVSFSSGMWNRIRLKMCDKEYAHFQACQRQEYPRNNCRNRFRHREAATK